MLHVLFSLQAVIVVSPESDEPLDLNNVSNRKFLVIQKLHTFSALCELDRKGKFKDLVGHSDRTIMCYVIRPEQFPIIPMCIREGTI